jgi:uncharacterized membrane protein YhaH (DUF805 family)
MIEVLSRYFLSHGRIPRAIWFGRIGLLAIVCSAFGMLADALAGDAGAALLAVLFVWGASATSIQRLHDIGRRGTAMFLLLIPILGPVWLFMLLCRRGAEGTNRHGADPMARHDYLRVDIGKSQ